MENLIVKNKRMKMSPAGVITLTVAARKALGMKVNMPEKVSVMAEGNSIVIRSGGDATLKTYRVSKHGQMVLGGEAKEVLMKSKDRYYWLKLDDGKHEARLMPF
jgi:hypothetical protein